MPERWSDDTAELVDAVINVSGSVPDARKRADLTDAILAALADAGLLVEPGGETRSVFRCYDLVSGGAYQTETLEELEDFCRTDGVLHQPDSFGPPPHPKEHQTATVTEWQDGSVHTGPWQPTDTKEPSP